ncbi:MAG: hypothetical protein MZU84_06190 [Sphingobacterium sp.]|nr:hypothetical protein [Sphingobacterium sp.]
MSPMVSLRQCLVATIAAILSAVAFASASAPPSRAQTRVDNPGRALVEERRPRRQARGGPADQGRRGNVDLQVSPLLQARTGRLPVLRRFRRGRPRLPVQPGRPAPHQALEDRAGARGVSICGRVHRRRRPGPGPLLGPAQDHGPGPGRWAALEGIEG